MRHSSLILMLLLLFGCQPLKRPALGQLESLQKCLSPSEQEVWQIKCEVLPWLEYWVDVSQLSWPVRKSMIAELSPGAADSDKLKLLLLSHVNDTPYQTRLRAQTHAKSLLQSQDKPLSTFIQFIVFEPAQQKLELESAITTLSRINSVNSKQIENQQELLQQQAQQIEKILQIEKSIVEQPTQELP